MRRAITPDTAAVLVEPIQGEGGIFVPPEGYLIGLRRICDEAHILLIFDEVQTGLGRTGAWFAFQHENAVPDGLVLGKALGGGVLPVSALVGTRALMDVFTPGSHGSTFGGNPLAASVGLEALAVIEEEGLVERSRVLGARMLARLGAIGSPVLKDVRGRGLLAGAEIDPIYASAREVCELLLHEARAVQGHARHGGALRAAARHRGEGSRLGARPVRGSAARDRAAASSSGRVREKKMAMNTKPRILMCRPRHFGVTYAINPWMDPKGWASEAQALAADARREWRALHATLKDAWRRDRAGAAGAGPARSGLHGERRRGDGRQGALGALPP